MRRKSTSVRDVFILAEIAVFVAVAGAVIFSVVLTIRAVRAKKPSDGKARRKRPY
jgi:hypothetical protein